MRRKRMKLAGKFGSRSMRKREVLLEGENREMENIGRREEKVEEKRQKK